MRSYSELLSDETAWPQICALAESAKARVTVLPRDPDAARFCLEHLQVTTRATLGALAHETGGLLVDHGWLRILGSGHPQLSRSLGRWNDELEIPLAHFVIVADDVIGGVFAINGGGLGPARGNVHYFAPDSLRWEDTGHGHTSWLEWALTGDLAKFYEHARWLGWEPEVEQVGGDRALSRYPPPWTVEGKHASRVSRRSVPPAELWSFHVEALAQLAGRG
ncbi:MAG TPA: DUF2625 family protein [Kofleriaceae bacterium]|jgi:hypothetical protein